MNGIKVYEENIENKIKRLLDTNPEYFSSYYCYICNKESLNTCYSYLRCIVRFMSKTNKQIENLTLDDFTNFLATYRNKSSSYQRSVYFGLKSFSSYLKASDKINKDYMKEVVSPKKRDSLETIQKRSRGYLEPEEIGTFITNVKTGIGSSRAITRQKDWKDRDMAIMYIFLTTGMRASALYKLDIGSIDWETKTLITIEKGDKVNTYILSDKTIAILEKWIYKRNELLKGKNEEALFISNQLTRISASTVSNLVKKYSINIEGKHITPHKLRATYGTELYKETRDIKFVQDRMGHANPQTTELYVRYDQTADKKRAADIMSKFLND